jgi:hypothetical protein
VIPKPDGEATIKTPSISDVSLKSSTMFELLEILLKTFVLLLSLKLVNGKRAFSLDAVIVA